MKVVNNVHTGDTLGKIALHKAGIFKVYISK